MTEISLNLNNFNDFNFLESLFPESGKYEFTSKKIFRLKSCITCPSCGQMMVHDGYDYARKKGFGKVRIGKQDCPCCGKQYHEDKSFWKNLLFDWKETTVSLIMTLRDSNVAWDVISKIMGFILPCSKDKARYLFNDAIEQFEYCQKNFVIVNYDEQHPKRGRVQKFRLTLLNYQTKQVIADELFDNKDDETVEAFLRKNLDPTRKIVIITDCDRRYPKIFRRIWGNNIIHQKCLLHLNKLIVADFGKSTTLLDEYNKYTMLNIFYNRKREIRFLDRQIKKQDRKCFLSDKEKKESVRKAKQKFYDYVKELENERRREGKNLPQRRLADAQRIVDKLWQQRMLLPKHAQSRLKMIKSNWKYFTAFYHFKGCPATNNAIENFYSTSLKTHRKKQLRTDRGIINHMKLSALKRIEKFATPKKTLLEIYGLVKLIVC